MILQGFEIENWTCIKKLAVAGLPPTGVIVLHGPNRTGKSSLVRAIRSCLMDNSSTSAALKSYYPRGSAEKPTVTVTFSTGGTTYRIKKCFGSNKSELVSRTAVGAWKNETASAAESHSRVCELVGGSDSAKGIQQLLWLTQAEFRLPDSKKFDSGVQSHLRNILGVLQTVLDDRFVERVKKRWNEWHIGQRKAAKPKLKEGCNLAGNLAELEEARTALADSEAKFQTVEALLGQCTDLEVRKKDFERQLAERSVALKRVQNERERCQARFAARTIAEQSHASAEKEHLAALQEWQQRAEAERRAHNGEEAVEPARKLAEDAEQKVQSGTEKQEDLKVNLAEQRNQQRDMQRRANAVAAALRAVDAAEQLKTAQETFQRASEAKQQIDDAEKRHSAHPVPNEAALKALKENRQKILELEADCTAASMMLTVVPDVGAASAQLLLDGGSPRPLPNIPRPFAVRHKAELHISGWGRVELSRSTSKGNLDEIEAELQKCRDAYTEGLAAYGIAATDPDAFDQLLRRCAEKVIEGAALEKQKADFRKLAPKGLEPLQRKVGELEAKTKVTPADADGADPLPSDPAALESLKVKHDEQLKRLGNDIEKLVGELEAADSALVKARYKAARAKEELARCGAVASSFREALGRLRSEAEIEQRLAGAKQDEASALEKLRQTELTAEEATIDQRLVDRKADVEALEEQIRVTEEKYNQNKGRIESSENLHAERASLAARVEELTRLTQQEDLERVAVDRLYELFEECREKQLGALMTPIHDRVLNWMRVLEIGDYKEVRFDDNFLPDKLVRRDGTAEFTLNEESTGAQEQIGMLVRLALGSLLTSASEPTVAILDDPLTHCDIGRLNKMRAILRRASEGDPLAKPPACPLQIIVLTCHPEWFRDERATVIDLESADVIQRFPV
jgi:DNA repair exonuclease SbcCD ATPase subunit